MERIFIFGKSATNFAEISQSSLNVNINCCDNSKLFICKGVCYKGLLKFQRVADNLQEVKKEIEEAFRAREKRRAKQLLWSEDGKPKEAPRLISHGNPRAKASKLPRFGTEASTCTTCNSSDSNSQPLFDVARPLAYFPGLLLPIGNHPYRFVLNAFPEWQVLLLFPAHISLICIFHVLVSHRWNTSCDWVSPPTEHLARNSSEF